MSFLQNRSTTASHSQGSLSQNVRRRLPTEVRSETTRCRDLSSLSYAFRKNLNRNDYPVLAPPERVLQAGCVSELIVRPIFAAHENVNSTHRREPPAPALRVVVSVVRGDAIGIEAQFGPASLAPCNWGPRAASSKACRADDTASRFLSPQC